MAHVFSVNGDSDSSDQSLGLFDSLEEAVTAWVAAGRPRARRSSVWVTEHCPLSEDPSGTVRTVTIG